MNEDKEISREEIDKFLFAHLINLLAQSALQQMGKIINPVTQKSEVDLEGAQMSIDMLDMIDAKTRGNLDEQEKKMLTNALMGLKMNYVEMTESAPAGTAAAEAPEKQPSAEDASPKIESAEGGGESKEPKFRKTY